jgi:chemotaxis signal transduction protein
MNEISGMLARRLQELRQNFDAAFARPFEAAPQAPQSAALCCRSGTLRCALPLTELGGLFKARALLPAPARGHGFVGFGFFRSVLIPVYELGAWIDVNDSLRLQGWSILLGRSEVIAVRVDEIDGYAVFDQPAVALNPSPKATPYLQGAVEHKGESYALVDVKRLHQDVIDRRKPIEEAKSQA